MRKLNFNLSGANKRDFTLDVNYFENQIKKPLIIFSHGFKGFKDWGHFNLVAKEFAESGFTFLKFNFSHNGTTPESPTDFVDLEAFAQNNFSKELDDLGAVIDFILNEKSLDSEIDPEKIFLLGHSRGGAITLLKAAEDSRVKKAVTWASISDTEKRLNPPEWIDWKKNGVAYVKNARTGQDLPLYFQFYEDFYANKERLDLVSVSKKIKIPVLILHGTKDDSVHTDEAMLLKKNILNSELFVLKEADHSFGAKHPWTENRLPLHAQEIVVRTIQFLVKD
jgi:uncharacterized protein